MPLLETKGAASAQGFGGAGAGASGLVTYIEDVFSTYLYTGNSSTQTITNGIDLAGKGGLVWIKERNNTFGHVLVDTSRGINQVLRSNNTAAQTTYGSTVSAFNSNGFSLGSSSQVNDSFAGYELYASWTFREQPKFFDVVTYTGNGANRTISHNLGSVPGCIIVKRTDTTADWQVYHRSNANTQYMVLNSTAVVATGTTRWNSTTPTSTVFSLGTDTTVNASGGTYVAYLFAHDAGGFGLSGTDNVISCGSYTGSASATTTVTLGYEPQWLLVKRADSSSTGDWYIFDNMRGVVTGGVENTLSANTSSSESTALGDVINFTATGFIATGTTGNLNSSGSPYIYIAIRRGPMKVPTSGTSVYNAIARTGTSAAATVTAGFPVDMVAIHMRNSTNNEYVADRLRGGGLSLEFCTTAAESDRSAGGITSMASNTGFSVGTYSDVNSSPNSYINWCFQRAPGFFDVVCYTGTGVARTVSHNLGVTPEMVVIKRRNGAAENWYVYHAALGAGNFINLDLTAIPTSSNQAWNNTAPTASVFTVGTLGGVNSSSNTFVAYLFATCPGVSKVGSYTGTGALQTINCGFTGGARFVLIKRTDSTGDWYVYDSARGIVAGSDPYLTLNTTAAEVTTTDWVDTYSAGFELSNAGGNNVNINGATYIFLSVA